MASGLPTAFKHIKNNQKPLRFNSDGKFRILHLTDIHEVPLPPEDEDKADHSIERGKSRQSMRVINECLDRAKPDLVIFGGDNISGFPDGCTYSHMRNTIKRIVEPVKERNIPLAVIFGNHDSEMLDKFPFTHREMQFNIFAEYDNLRTSMNDEDIFGCASCSLPILRSDSDEAAWNIWCVESNDYIRQPDYSRPEDLGYDYIHKDQLEWREHTQIELKEQNGGNNIPSLLFQHIPLFQLYDLFEEVDCDEPGAIKQFGKYYKIPDSAFISGSLREAPCPPKDNRDELESMKKSGDIVAAFFGHDHPNDFTAKIDGIDLVQTLGVRYYADAGTQGGRLIIIDENKPDSYETVSYQIDRQSE